MCQVSKQILAIVKGTPKLLLKFCFEAVDKSKLKKHQYTTCFPPVSPGELCNYPGFNVKVHSSSGRGRPDVQATFTLSKTAIKLPTAGTTWRRMFLCQPPVDFMQGHLSFAKHIGKGIMKTVYSAARLTVGDLYDGAAKLLEQDETYRNCSRLQRDGMSDDPGGYG